jgi:hypothetical protein
MGGLIKRYWFNATDPLLPDHVYRADVSPGGGKVKITVHQRAKLGRAGLIAYVIDFEQSGSLHGDHQREPQNAVRPCHKDAVRHQPLATRPGGLRQDNAKGVRARRCYNPLG